MAFSVGCALFCEDQSLRRATRLGVELALIHGSGDERAEVRVHAPGLGQKNTAFRRHDGMAFEQMVEGGATAVARVCALDRLRELHLIAHEDDRFGSTLPSPPSFQVKPVRPHRRRARPGWLPTQDARTPKRYRR